MPGPATIIFLAGLSVYAVIGFFMLVCGVVGACIKLTKGDANHGMVVAFILIVLGSLSVIKMII